MYYPNGQRQVSFRYDVVRKGVLFSRLEAVDAPCISMTSQGEIKTSFTGTFVKNPQVDFLTDRIRPYMIIDGEEYPLGVYVVTTPEESYSGGQVFVEVTGYDLGYLLKRSSLEERLYLQTGRLYLEAVQELLAAAGITDVLYDAGREALQTDREDWEVGTPLISIVNQLLQEAGYDSLWFDFQGNARLTRYRQPSEERVRLVYRSGECSVLEEACTSSSDLFGKYNVFRVVVDNPELPQALTATAVNDDPNSPFSTVHIGRVQAPIEQLNNIASQQALQDYIDRRKLQSMLATETVTFTTANMPVHGVGEVVALEHEYLQGIFEETEWEMELGVNGRMTHTARRVLYL